MQANTANLESFKRQLFTVNSTNSDAFAVTDVESIAAEDFAVRLLPATQTDEDAVGKFIDLALSRANPFIVSSQNGGVLTAATTGEQSQGSYSLPTRIVLAPFGTDAANETFTLNVYAVFPTYTVDTEGPKYYTFEGLISLTVTLGAIGGATYGLPASNLWAKDIAVVASSDNCIYQLLDGSAWAGFPAGGQIAIATNGARFLYIAVTSSGGSAASMNLFVRSV